MAEATPEQLNNMKEVCAGNSGPAVVRAIALTIKASAVFVIVVIFLCLYVVDAGVEHTFKTIRTKGPLLW